MASGAGLNIIGNAGAATLLIVNPSSTANATPLTSYGNAGNDSGFVGPAIVEGKGFTKIMFSVVPIMGSTTWSGYTIQFWGTTDSRALEQWRASMNPYAYFGVVGGAPAVPSGAWFPLIAQADQAGGSSDTNPITTIGQSFSSSRGPLVGVRAVLIATSGAAGTAAAQALAVP